MSSTNSQDGSSKRFDGLDLARAFAVFGMVIVNFKVVMTCVSGPDDMYGYLRFIGSLTLKSDPAWLIAFTGSLEGRAAATFVTLAGGGTALAVICLGLGAARRWPAAWWVKALTVLSSGPCASSPASTR